MPNRWGSQNVEEALCQIDAEIESRKNFSKFLGFLKKNLISRIFAVQPRRLAEKFAKNQHFLMPFA